MDDKLSNFLDNIPIAKSDILYIASDILTLLIYHKKNNSNFDPNELIDYFYDRVGPEGTLLFPTFNWDFCRGKGFNYKSTGSETGSLSKIALSRKDFIRTKHPIYSFVAKGKDSEKLFQLDDLSGWGPKSLFAYFYENKAKNLFIGIDYKNGFTFDHYFEEKIGVDYRYFKNFEGDYVDKEGNKLKKIYKMYVRDLEKNIETAISDKMDDELVKKKGYQKFYIDNVYFGLVDLKIAGDLMHDDLTNKGGLIYTREFTG